MARSGLLAGFLAHPNSIKVALNIAVKAMVFMPCFPESMALLYTLIGLSQVGSKG